jgi:dTDP-4-amino-4,6-dideoxygalactose transaminase
VSDQNEAIIVVDAGIPVDVKVIQALSKNNIPVIEDAALMHGAKYKVKRGLTFSTLYSFQTIKHLTTIDGGALQILDNDLYEGKVIRWFGLDKRN